MSAPTPCCSPLLPALADPVGEQLASGVEVVTMALPQAPLVCLDFWCRAGSAFEQEGESGLAHFLEHMVFKGSEALAAGEFDARLEALGGSSNAATGFDDVHYHVLIPPQAAGEALDLLLDLVLRPRLEAEAFAMERQVVLEELAQSEDQPEEVALQRLLSLALPDHPYGQPILGQREALLAHTPEAMASFHSRLYGAGRCVLALSGATEEAGLAERIRQGPLAGLRRAAEPATAPEPRLRPGEERIALPRLEAARLLMAWQLPAAHDEEAVMGADLATSLLAEGRRSRLVERLREQLRLVESVDMELHALESGSLALLEAVCDPEDLPQLRREIQQVWSEVMDAPLSSSEWERTCRQVANSYRFGLESAGAVAGLIGSGQLWGRRRGLVRPLELIQAWSPQRLQREALMLLQPQRACILEAVPA